MKSARFSRSLLVMLLSTILFHSQSMLQGATTPSFAQTDDSRLFPETGHTVKGRFLQYWLENGELAQQGFPISEELQDISDIDGNTYTMQYFERAVFESHPENTTPYDVLLSLLGTFEYERRYSAEVAPGEKASTDNPVLFKETGKSLGGLFRKYWEGHGGIRQQGFPISEEFQEKSALDGKVYTVQYFERAVFEHHPENAGTEHEVLLAQLGKFQHDKRYNSVPAATPSSSVPSPSPTTTRSNVPAEISGWLREHVIPIRTADPDGDQSDLLPIKQVVGDARIVMLGEAAHGGHEFQTVKHRMVRFLVEEMGFTIFAIEDDWAAVQTVNDYVLTGQGNPEQIVNRLPIVFWRTREMVDMVKWMRAYNANRGSAPPVKFQGVDMQRPNAAMDIVLGYLRTVDPAAAERAQQRYNCFALFSVFSEPEKVQCFAGLQAVYDELVANQESYTAASSAEAFANAQFGARIVLQSAERRRGQVEGRETIKSLAVRDRAMADNLSLLLEQAGPGAKAISWAHNGHIGMVVGEAEFSEYKSMGWVVKQKYGQSALLIGFDFYNGSFNARGNPPGPMLVHKIDASPAGSYPDYFHSANSPNFLLDLRRVDLSQSGAGWLAGTRQMWSIGSVFDASYPQGTMPELSLTQTFDAVVHIDTIKPTSILP